MEEIKEKTADEIEGYTVEDYKIAMEFLLNIGGRTIMQWKKT